MSTIKALFEEREKAVGELRALHDDAEGRELTAEEGVINVRMNTELDVLQGRIERGVSELEREKKADEARSRFEDIEPRASAPAETEKRTARDVFKDLDTGRERSARFEFRDDVILMSDTSTEGIELVQTDLSHNLVDFLSESQNSMINLAKVVTTTSGNPITIPTVSSHSTILLEGETDTIANSAPQFSTVTLNAYKYAVLVKVSRELLADSAFPVIPFIMDQAAYEIGQLTGQELITGSGSSAPQGIDLATTLSVTSASTTEWTADELITVYHTLTSGYRQNATWLMADATVQELRALKDGNGQYLWQSGMAAGLPDMLFGKPVVTDNAVMVTATGNESIIFGDIERAYCVRVVNGLDVARSDDFAFDTDVTTFRFVARLDGVITDQNAVVVGHQA